MPAAAAREKEPGRDQRPDGVRDFVKVWDPFVRVFHWSLVVLFALAWLTEHRQALHQPIGYAILALAALRIVWAEWPPCTTWIGACKVVHEGHVGWRRALMGLAFACRFVA
jgi:hypothetical protein